MGIYANDVQKLYIAYFNRPADPVGLQYWEDQITANKGSTAAVANAFSASAEYKSLYAGKSSAQIVETIYQNLFGRSAEASGLIYWGVRLENGTFNVGNIAMSIMVGAQNDDKKVIDNKLVVATEFTAGLNTSAAILAYSGDAAAAAASTFLKTVTATDASLTAAKAAVASTITSIATTTVANGTNYTLTTAIDTLTGTANNDTFNAVVDTTNTTGVSTLNTGDAINGGAGTDTLNVTYSGTTGNPTFDLKAVEAVNLRALVATTQNTATWEGVQSITSDRSTAGVTLQNVASAETTFGLNKVTGAARESFTVTFATNPATNDTVAFDGTTVTVGATQTVAALVGLVAGATYANWTVTASDATSVSFVAKTGGNKTQTFTMSGNTTATVGSLVNGSDDLTIGMTAAAVAGAADTLKLNVVDSGKTVLSAATETAAATYSYANVVTGAGFEALSVNSTGTGSAIDVSNIGTAVKTVTATGSAAVEVANLSAAALRTVTSSNTAGLSLDVRASTLDITANAAAGANSIRTGSGADTIVTGAGNDTINAGTGNDTVTSGAGNDTITVGAGTVKVDAGDGDDVIIVAGLDKTDVIDGGTGTDVLGLTNSDATAASAATTAGAELRAAYKGVDILRVTDTLATAINAGRLGFNSIQLDAGVSDGGAGTTVAVTGLTSGATIEVRSTTNFVDSVAVGMTDAATTTDDVLNIKLNANLLVATNNVQTSFDVEGINNINITANDRVNFAGDDSQTLNANKDNGPDDGYTVALVNSANLNKVTVAGTSKITYAVNSSSSALKTIDATASTGNLDITATAFAGTERLTIKGSQGDNVIVGSNTSFGDAIVGGAKNDVITGNAGGDALTGGGGRDSFVYANGNSTRTAMDKISDFGKVSTAVIASDVTAMTDTADFQSATLGKGGADADVLDLAGTASLMAAASNVSTGVIAALQAVDASNTEFDTATVTFSLSAKGILTVGGTDAAKVNTIAEYMALANLATDTTGRAVAFELGGNTYVFQQANAGDAAVADTIVELTGVTGVTGLIVVGGTVAASAGDVFVM